MAGLKSGLRWTFAKVALLATGRCKWLWRSGPGLAFYSSQKQWLLRAAVIV